VFPDARYMELILTISDGSTVADALSDAVVALKPLTTSALAGVNASANGIQLSLETGASAELTDAITDVTSALGVLGTSTLTALSTDDEDEDEVVLSFANSSDDSSESDS